MTGVQTCALPISEPGTAIVGVPDGEQGRGTAFVPGQVVPVRDPYSGRSLNLTIIGVTTSWGTAPSVWTNAATATNLAGPLTVNRLLLPENAVPPSTPASPIASAGAVGVKSIGEVIAGQQQPERALLRLLQGHLAVGFLTA